MQIFNQIKESLLHVLFPHTCAGCGNDTVPVSSDLCLRCLNSLPETNFHNHAGNPVEKIFYGRLAIQHATAHFYFSKESLIQKLLHQVKYKNNRSLGFQLGQLMGVELLQTERFNKVDAIIPLPLFAAKERKRGYNQATVICEGINDVMKIPVLKDAVIRTQHTDTQTKKGRVARWENIEGKFSVIKPELLASKHVLLVDDIITTGATLEACGAVIKDAGNTALSIASLCYASK